MTRRKFSLDYEVVLDEDGGAVLFFTPPQHPEVRPIRIDPSLGDTFNFHHIVNLNDEAGLPTGCSIRLHIFIAPHMQYNDKADG
jgi:hypothetical protein